MKKIILFSMLSIMIAPSISFGSNVNYSITNHKNYIVQDQTIKAYIYFQEQWHEGYISISNGVLASYQFSSLEDRINRGGQLTGYFQGNEKFIKLNENNNLAIKYNFTHYVDFKGYRAYIMAN